MLALIVGNRVDQERNFLGILPRCKGCYKELHRGACMKRSAPALRTRFLIVQALI